MNVTALLEAREALPRPADDGTPEEIRAVVAQSQKRSAPPSTVSI